VARSHGARVGIVFITPLGGLVRYSFRLLEIYSNDMPEYKVLIISPELALEMHIDQLEQFGDSQLII